MRTYQTPRIALRRARRIDENSYDVVDMYYHRFTCDIQLTEDEELLRARLHNVWGTYLTNEDDVISLHVSWCKSVGILITTDTAISDLNQAKKIFTGSTHVNYLARLIKELQKGIGLIKQQDSHLIDRMLRRLSAVREMQELERQ